MVFCLLRNATFGAVLVLSFYGEICTFYRLIQTPDFLHFYYILDANLGYLLYEDVSVM